MTWRDTGCQIQIQLLSGQERMSQTVSWPVTWAMILDRYWLKYMNPEEAHFMTRIFRNINSRRKAVLQVSVLGDFMPP